MLRHYLINYARPLIYTTFLSYPALAAIRTSYLFLAQGRTVSLAAHLRSLIQALFAELNAVRTANFNELLRVPLERPKSPIFSIQLDDPKALAKYLQDKGMMVRAVVPPTVPEGTSRVRVCLHAGNTVEEIRRLVGTMEEWCARRAQSSEAETTKRVGKEDGVLYARL